MRVTMKCSRRLPTTFSHSLGRKRSSMNVGSRPKNGRWLLHFNLSFDRHVDLPLKTHNFSSHYLVWHNSSLPGGRMSNRRNLIVALGASALLVPFGSFAQQQGKVWRVGFIGHRSRPDSLDSDIYGAF